MQNSVYPLQCKPIGLVAGLCQTASDIIVAFFQVEDQKVQGDTDHTGIEGTGAGGDAHIQEYIIIAAYRIFHDGMAAIEVIEELHECLPRWSLSASTQVDADQSIHAVIGDDSSHQLMMFPCWDSGHENYGIIRVMGILAAEEIDAFFLDIGFESIGLQILFMISLLWKWSDIVSHETTFLRSTRKSIAEKSKKTSAFSNFILLYRK